MDLSYLPNDVITYIKTFLIKECENCNTKIYLHEEVEDIEWTIATIMDDYWFEGCNKELVIGCIYCTKKYFK